MSDRSAMDVVARAVKPTHIFHLGAYTHVGKSWQRVDECVSTNMQGTLNLLQALADNGYERFVYTGTSEIYGDIDVPFREDAVVNPISPYSVSKYAGERYCTSVPAQPRLADRHGAPVQRVRTGPNAGPRHPRDHHAGAARPRHRDDPRAADPRVQLRRPTWPRASSPPARRRASTANCSTSAAAKRSAMRDLAKTILDLMGNPIEAKFGALPERPDRDHADVLRLDQRRARMLDVVAATQPRRRSRQDHRVVPRRSQRPPHSSPELVTHCGGFRRGRRGRSVRGGARSLRASRSRWASARHASVTVAPVAGEVERGGACCGERRPGVAAVASAPTPDVHDLSRSAAFGQRDDRRAARERLDQHETERLGIDGRTVAHASP